MGGGSGPHAHAQAPAGGFGGRHGGGGGGSNGGSTKDSVSRTEITFILGLVCFATITAVWTSLLPSSALPGTRRGELARSEGGVGGEPFVRSSSGGGVNSGGNGNGDGAPTGFFQQTQPRLVAQIQQNLRGRADDVFGGGGGGGGAVAGSPSRPRRLTLSSHGRLMWFDVDTRRAEVIHEGRGVYYGVFPADASGDTVWVRKASTRRSQRPFRTE